MPRGRTDVDGRARRSADTTVSMHEAHVAIDKAFAAADEPTSTLSIKAIVAAAGSSCKVEKPQEASDWSAMLRAPPDPRVAAKSAAPRGIGRRGRPYRCSSRRRRGTSTPRARGIFHGHPGGRALPRRRRSNARPRPRTRRRRESRHSKAPRPEARVPPRYAAEHRKKVDVRERLVFTLQDKGAMFRLCTHFARIEDADHDGGLGIDEFTHLFHVIDPEAPPDVIRDMFGLADTNQAGSVDTWELMPIMHRMINHALHHNAITQPLRDCIQKIYEADCNIQAEVSATLASPGAERESAMAKGLAAKFA